MPQTNVKKIVKKAVAKEERKQHSKKKRRGAGPKPHRDRRVNNKNKGSNTGRMAKRTISNINNLITAEERAAGELAKALCCPNMYPSFRVQDGYSSMPTGCADPFMVVPASFVSTDGSATDANGIAHDETFACAFRDPRRCLMYYDANPRTYAYTIYNESGEVTTDLVIGETFNTCVALVDSGVTTTAVHGAQLNAGILKEGNTGVPLLLAQKNQTLVINGLTASTAATFGITVYADGTCTKYKVTKTADGTGTFTSLFSDFRSLLDDTDPIPTQFFYFGAIENMGANGVVDGQFSIHGSAIPTLCQLSLASFENVASYIKKARFNALNLMYSNTAPPLSRNGYACGWQAPSDEDPIVLLLQGFEALCSKSPDVERMEANEGIHGFWKSTDPLDWEYLEVNSGTSVQNTYFELDGDSDFLVVSLKQPQGAGRAGYWSIFSDVQYRHDTVWIGHGLPGHSRNLFEKALEIQGRIPQWHCNPFHIKDIFNWVGKHKNQIKDSLGMVDDFTNNRSSMITNPARKFLDIWFR